MCWFPRCLHSDIKSFNLDIFGKSNFHRRGRLVRPNKPRSKNPDTDWSLPKHVPRALKRGGAIGTRNITYNTHTMTSNLIAVETMRSSASDSVKHFFLFLCLELTTNTPSHPHCLGLLGTRRRRASDGIRYCFYPSTHRRPVHEILKHAPEPLVSVVILERQFNCFRHCTLNYLPIVIMIGVVLGPTTRRCLSLDLRLKHRRGARSTARLHRHRDPIRAPYSYSYTYPDNHSLPNATTYT